MDTAEITHHLNEAQRRAVTHGDGPLLIVAGAGTGKTTVITQRLAWLVATEKARSDQVLALTFTERAAAELEERVDQLLPLGYTDLWVSTFHSFCERVLQAHGLDIGLPNHFRVLDTTGQWLLVRRHLDLFKLKYYKPLGNPTKFIHALLSHFSRAKDEGVLPADYRRFARSLSASGVLAEGGEQTLTKAQVGEIARAYATYQSLLWEEGCLDFGDLITQTLRLFTDRPHILERYQRQFRYTLVDEFQDTNWAQYQLVKLLAAPNNNLTVVGDDDQAIYRFRGASLSNILEFTNDYPAAERIVLTDNYRSAQSILDAAHGFIQHNNPYRLECRLQESPELVAEAAQKGLAADSLIQIDKRLRAASDGPGIVAHLAVAAATDEVRTVLQKIVELKKAEPTLNWSDFAILVRANAQAKPFTLALEQSRIPFHFFALRGLYSKPVVLDCLAYLSLLDNYHESPSFWRVLTWPVCGLSAADQVELSHAAHRAAESLYQAARRAVADGGIVSDQGREQLANLLGQIERHTAAVSERLPSELLLGALTDTGYLTYLKDQANAGKTEAIDYLRQLFTRIRDYEGEVEVPTLKGLLEVIGLQRESGDEGSLQFDPETGPDTVRVMTVHAAKGLEFAYVFVVNMVQQRFPTSERSEPIPLPDALVREVVPLGDIHLAEERRLFYVALTRAKRGVFLTSAADYGGVRAKKPSRFLAELGVVAQAASPADGVGERGERPTTVAQRQTLPVPTRFTYSQLSSFGNCPLQYKYAYVLKIPTFGKASLSFGSTIHATLQKFLAQVQRNGEGESRAAGPLPSLETLLECYRDSWNDSWYPDAAAREEYRQKGEKTLRAYYRVLQKTKPQPLRLEEQFFIRIGEYRLTGKIDRIDQLAGGVEIIDYKTGQGKTALQGDDRDQLLIYQLAAQEAFGYTPKRLTYYYIEDGKALSFLGSEADQVAIREKIVQTITKIQQSDFSPTPGWACRFCDFKDICEFRDPHA